MQVNKFNNSVELLITIYTSDVDRSYLLWKISFFFIFFIFFSIEISAT